MGQAHLRQSRGHGLLNPMLSGHAQDHRGQADQATDGRGVVPFGASTAVGRDALCPIGKKVPVVRLGIGVVVAVGGGHEGHILRQKILCVVAMPLRHGAQHQSGAQGVQGVLARLHALVVMPVGWPPVVLFAFENDFAHHLAHLHATTGARRA